MSNSCCINLGHTGPDGVQVTIIRLQYLSNSKTTDSYCINLGLTGPDGVQVTIISYNIYQTLKLLVTHVVLTLVTLDQMVYKSQSSGYNIYQTLKLLIHTVLTLVSLDQTAYKSQ